MEPTFSTNYSGLVCMTSPIPQRHNWILTFTFSPTAAAFHFQNTVRLTHYLSRGLLNLHSRYGLYTCKLPCDLYTGGLRQLDAFLPALLATDGGNIWLVRLSPTRVPRLFTAHCCRIRTNQTIMYEETRESHPCQNPD